MHAKYSFLIDASAETIPFVEMAFIGAVITLLFSASSIIQSCQV